MKKEIDFRKVNKDCTELDVIERGIAMQDAYTKTYYDEKIVKCKYLSDEFLDYISRDKRIQDTLSAYNEKHDSDYDFNTYILMEPKTIKTFAYWCLNDSECKYKLDNYETDYEFRFIIPKSGCIPTYEEFVNSIGKGQIPIPLIWHDYLKQYFQPHKITIIYNSDEYRELLKKSYFVQKQLYEVNHGNDIYYKRSEKYGHIDIDELSKINKCNLYEHWGLFQCETDLTTLVEGEKYTFNFHLPISDNIPSYDEFIKTHFMMNKTLDVLIEEEEKKCIENMKKRFGTSNGRKIQPITSDEFLKRYRFYKNSKKRKIGKKIEKYEVTGRLIETYSDRNECIEKNNFTKSALSKHLSGKRKTLNGYVYKEVD